MTHPAPLATAILALALAGCIGHGLTPDSGDRLPASSGAFVLAADQLPNENATILDAMIGRVPNMRVDRSTQCPAIALRGGGNPAPGITDPAVYVDGTRTDDTCVLTLLRAGDVERVEVYPMGFTQRAGYTTSSRGLILVFLRRT